MCNKIRLFYHGGGSLASPAWRTTWTTAFRARMMLDDIPAFWSICLFHGPLQGSFFKLPSTITARSCEPHAIETRFLPETGLKKKSLLRPYAIKVYLTKRPEWRSAPGALSPLFTDAGIILKNRWFVTEFQTLKAYPPCPARARPARIFSVSAGRLCISPPMPKYVKYMEWLSR